MHILLNYYLHGQEKAKEAVITDPFEMARVIHSFQLYFSNE